MLYRGASTMSAAGCATTCHCHGKPSRAEVLGRRSRGPRETSTLPRVAFEHGQIWCASSTRACMLVRTMPMELGVLVKALAASHQASIDAYEQLRGFRQGAQVEINRR